MWIVELEPGVWLADGDGDPPRTLARENAKRFVTRQEALRAIDDARRWRPFDNATVLVAELERRLDDEDLPAVDPELYM